MPKNFSTDFPGMSHITKNRQCEFLEWPLGTDDSLQQWDDAIKCCLLLPGLAQPTEVVHGIQDLVRNFLREN